ncbi:centrosomal protein 43 [Pseudophryne corroboree]|uniref:centrosomal protein 43 n=1 Tax=Pseudophryne corroboree TaxID=495146 RepID=UPI003081C51C
MSAAEEDTELRDLLIHTLESNGVLSKIKAELRASVFLALDEQERADNKPSLVNHSLRQFLGTRDGRLVAGLVTDFLQHFHLDFTMAVLQPEAGLPSTPDERAVTARELGLSEAGRKGPLILELLRHHQQQGEPALSAGEKARYVPQEVPPADVAEAQAKFELYARDKDGGMNSEEARALLTELFPHLPENTLARYAAAEHAIDWPGFLAVYRRLRVAAQDRLLDGRSESPAHLTETHAASNGLRTEQGQAGLQPSRAEPEEDIEGDSFFDDPIPKLAKTYGWQEEGSKSIGSLSGHSLAVLSGQGSLPGAPQQPNDSHRGVAHITAYGKGAPQEAGAGNEEDYMDDFNSTSQRSDRSEGSIGEDLDEELSADDFTGSDHKLEDFTQDNSISHLSDVADYLEDVS